MLIIGGLIENFATRKDKTLKVVFSTNEISPETTGTLISLNQKFCYIALKLEEFNSNEIEVLNSLKSDFNDNSKSQSTRLKNVFFVLWKQNNEGFVEFKDYYSFKMEKIISHYKTKINE